MRILTLMLGLLLSSTAFASVEHPRQTTVDRAIEKEAKKVGVPPQLLRAICQAESHLNPQAYAYNDGGVLGSAIGMCQILSRVAFGDGSKEGLKCSRDFRDPSSRKSENCSLFSPYTNAYYAAKKIKELLKKYDNNWFDAISAYNSGSLKECPKSGRVYNRSTHKFLWKCSPGGVLNEKYVDRVIKNMRDDQ